MTNWVCEGTQAIARRNKIVQSIDLMNLFGHLLEHSLKTQVRLLLKCASEAHMFTLFHSKSFTADSERSKAIQ